MSLLTEADGHRIEEAIARLERESAAELVVAVIPESATYARWRALVAAAWAVAAAVAYFRFVPWGSELWALLLQIPVGLAVWYLLGVPVLRRRLIPEEEAERAVRAEALRIFAERGVYKTRERTGILLLLSELEHRVVLLGDEGIDASVGDASWQRHVEHVVARIREHRAADGIVEVIDELRGVLSQCVPARDQIDELGNRLLREQGRP